MRAYELPVKISPEGKIEVPTDLLKLLPRGNTVRIIILVPEPTDSQEQSRWSRLTAEQFLAGYNEADSIYDRSQ